MKYLLNLDQICTTLFFTINVHILLPYFYNKFMATTAAVFFFTVNFTDCFTMYKDMYAYQKISLCIFTSHINDKFEISV